MSEAKETLETFKEIQNMEAVPAKSENHYLRGYQQPNLQATTLIGRNGNELANILMDNIRKVKENKEFIPQATTISEAAKTIIDLAKTEIEMHKVAVLMSR